jgi:capsule polysaccharide export protein KpsE/RkpR
MSVLLPEDQLKELHALTKENNKMLKAMRRDAFIGGIIHFVWWVIIIVVLPYFTWLWLQPYLEGMLNAYQTAQGQSSEVAKTIEDLKNAGSGFDFQKLLDMFKGMGQ